MDRMQQQNIASKLTLEEKCYLISDKDFWQNCSMRTKGSLNMALSSGLHSIRKQEGTSSWA